ncbi:MAG: carboxypeptidase regulatory-like domain-containing protein, partial [Bryobacterales bacterium]|nr:carboxypeptidase regulatory-like domain-containing protein [Bryobacterales bacterium]
MSRVLLLGLVFLTAAFAQYDAGAILGTITDPSGAVVAGVKVTLESVRTGVKQTATTDADGSYQFLNQRIGEYKVSAEAAGFKTVNSESFILTVNARQRVNLALQVGDVSQSIAVTG